MSLNTVERFFVTDASGKPVHPRYVLNGFDASQPLRPWMCARQQLGDSMPFVIRRSPAVSHEGMTVMDYAPETAVAGDVLNLAAWLRTQAAPAPGFEKGAVERTRVRDRLLWADMLLPMLLRFLTVAGGTSL